MSQTKRFSLSHCLEHLWVIEARQSRGAFIKELIVWIVVICALDWGLALMLEGLECCLAVKTVDAIQNRIVEPIGLFLMGWWLISLMIRRLHDLGLSGGFVLFIIMFPFSLAFVVLLALWPSREAGQHWCTLEQRRAQLNLL